MMTAASALRVAKVHHPLTALGPGRRVGLWLQGCAIGCRGCLSLDTWDASAVDPVPVDDVATVVVDALRADASLSGLTISGGEPTEQADAVVALLRAVRDATADRDPTVDVLLYSGRPWRRLAADHADLLALVDAVIPEPFVAASAPGGRWRGSSNQPLALLTPLARERYADADAPGPRELQLVVDGGLLWTVGVPGPGDLDRMLALARERGIAIGRVSWRV